MRIPSTISGASLRLSGLVPVAIVAMGFLLPASLEARREPRWQRPGDGHRLTAEKSGTVTTSNGLHLRLVTDVGNVVIHTQESGKVNYRVHLETDSRVPGAKWLLDQFTVVGRAMPDGVLLIGRAPTRNCGGRVWVNFEVNVPRDYNLDVSTQGGNIQIDDINGRAALSTSGGNITAGQIRGSARLITEGGHILVKGVAENLTATTAGGHITVGSIGGNAILHTGGGHIRVASVGGAATLDTGGGNISLALAGEELVATTGGGQIEVGEASGRVRARTGGGGIRVVRVTGPTNLEAGAGNIYLAQVENAVSASTGAGGITAWFGPGAKLESSCRLESGEGDIVVYLPQELPLTVDAMVELSGEHRVIVDPGLPLKVSYEESGGARAVRAEGSLNGGGPTLLLRTVAGNIRLILSTAAREQEQQQILKQQMDQLRRQLQLQLKIPDLSPPAAPAPPDQP